MVDVLNDKGTVIVCTGRPELAYVMAWCDERGKTVAGYIRHNSVFPYGVSVWGQTVGWTERMDRNLHYVPFADFVTAIKEQAA